MICADPQMATIAASVLLLSAYLLVRRRLGLRSDEALLLAGLLACLEAVAAIQALAVAAWLAPGSVRVVTAALIGLHLGLAYTRPPVPAVGRIKPLPRWLIPAAAAVAATMAVRLLLAAVSPPDGWDALGYHLPFVARWVHQGGLDLAGWVGTHRYFAWNGDLLSAWLAFLDGGALGTAKLAQVLGLPILAAAGSSLGRRLAGARWAAACSLALASLPIVLIQSGMAYVDVLYAAFWTASVAASIAWAKTGRAVDLLAFAAGAGLAWGTKSTFFFLAPLLMVPVVALGQSAPCRKSAARLWAPASALAFAAGAGSYIRNIILTGNPIYPLGLTLAGHRIFKGIVSAADFPAAYEQWYVPSSWGWLLYPFKETVRGVWGYTHLNGFGPLFALGWLFFAVSVWAAWKRRDSLRIAFLALVPAVIVLFLTLQPVRIPRYIIFLAPIPIVGMAAVFGRARGRRLAAARVLFTLAVIGGCAGVWAYMARQPGYRYAGTMLLTGSGVDAAGYYKAQYGSLGEAWAALNRELEPGDRVAINDGELSLPWAGTPPRARVRVVLLGRSPYPEAIAEDTFEGWMAAIDRLEARYLVVWSPAWWPESGRRAREAARSRPDRFEPLIRTASAVFGEVDVFRVRLQ